MAIRNGWLALFALMLVALSGCTLQDQEGNPLGTSDIISQQPLTIPKYAEPGQEICREAAGPQPCLCMACQNRTSYSGMFSWLGDHYDGTLAGGNCSMLPCNISDYYEIVSSSENVQMRAFALGAGQSFVSSGMAGRYCNYSLQLATKWMKGGEGAPPRVPQASRATCWLERSMLPLFIYYTGGKAIDPARTAQIAQSFNAADVGPALITTEAGWDGSDLAAAQLVRQQVLAIDSCDKCLTVLAVKPGDYQALYNVMGVPGALDRDYYERIDAVGFGFRANDYPHCSADRIIYENLNFSQYILQKYNKPTIWLYVGASEGNSSIGGEGAGGCAWSGGEVQEFYSQLLARAGGLASLGVVGMSLYEFVDRTGPIPCNGVQGCDFGMLLANGSQKHPELNSWSAACREVNVESEARKPLIFSKNGQGSACDVPGLRYSDQALMAEAARIASSQGLENGIVGEADRAKKGLGCGEACPSNVSLAKPAVYDGTGSGFVPAHCKLYPIIDERADDADISATYFRAIVEQESGFDPLAISCVDASSACNPEGLTAAQICEMAGSPEGCKRDACTAPLAGAAQKPCAYGLAQCIEKPGESDQFTKDCGGERYNPFDPGMSACCGAAKFGYYLRYSPYSAEKFVKDNWLELSSCPPYGMEEGEQGWAAYYLASNRYYGTVWNAFSDFISQRDGSGLCSGAYKHYIDYLRSLPSSPAPGTSYGAQVMSRFGEAVAACKSDCPT